VTLSDGEQTVKALRIADISIGLEAESPAMKVAFAGTHAAFLAESVSPEIEVRAAWSELSPGADGAQVFDAGGSWRLARSNGNYVLDFFTPLCGVVPYKRLTACRDWSRARVDLHQEFYDTDRPVCPFDYPLDELLLVHYLSQRSGVIVHACGIVDETGAGYLFVGHSGAGKTTTAFLWNGLPGITILSDDRIVLRRNEGRVLMHGTPWHGESRLSAPGSAELKAIFLLEQGPANEFSPVRPAEAAADLVARSFLAYHDGAGVAGVMSLFERIVAEVPCLRFSFTPGPAAVEAVREWARGVNG
jgi:hypothetical protein